MYSSARQFYWHCPKCQSIVKDKYTDEVGRHFVVLAGVMPDHQGHGWLCSDCFVVEWLPSQTSTWWSRSWWSSEYSTSEGTGDDDPPSYYGDPYRGGGAWRDMLRADFNRRLRLRQMAQTAQPQVDDANIMASSSSSSTVVEPTDQPTESPAETGAETDGSIESF